jgi:predicted transcriptional regulator
MSSESSWTFLTNHAHVLVLLSRDPDLRLRDLAAEIGITERAAQRIVSELAAEGYIELAKEGRRNHYTVLTDKPLRHPVERGATIADLLAAVSGR